MTTAVKPLPERANGMKLWQCSHHGCSAQAAGTGGPIGLRAVGWYFVPGELLYCPMHRPDLVPCGAFGGANGSEPAGEMCSLCSAEIEADLLQHLVRAHVSHTDHSFITHILHDGSAMCPAGGSDTWPDGVRGVSRAAWSEATCNRCRMNHLTLEMMDAGFPCENVGHR